MLKKDNDATLYEIEIPKDKQTKKNPIYMSPSMESEFKDFIETEKERLLKELTRNERYPNIFGYGTRKIPNLGVSNIPFDKAVIADEYIDMSYGEAYIVIKTQIDADNEKGKQYSWLKYRIKFNPNSYLEEHKR